MLDYAVLCRIRPAGVTLIDLVTADDARLEEIGRLIQTSPAFIRVAFRSIDKKYQSEN